MTNLIIEKSIDLQLIDKFLLFLVCWGTLVSTFVRADNNLMRDYGQVKMIARVANTFESLDISQGWLSKNLTSTNLNKKRFINFSGHVYDALWRQGEYEEKIHNKWLKEARTVLSAHLHSNLPALVKHIFTNLGRGEDVERGFLNESQTKCEDCVRMYVLALYKSPF